MFTPTLMVKSTLLASLILATGCTTVVREPEIMNGSKSEGIVELGVESGLFENVEGDWSAALTKAETSCKGWGYSGAQAFTPPKNQCVSKSEAYYNPETSTYTGESCYRYAEVAKYQCTE